VVKRYRCCLEPSLLLLRCADTPTCREAPLDTVATRRPAGPRTSIYARIDQLYGMILAVPSIYDACQPDRRANNDRATLPSSLPLTEPIIRQRQRHSYDKKRALTMVRRSREIRKSAPTRVRPRGIRIPPPEGAEDNKDQSVTDDTDLLRSSTRKRREYED